MNSLGVGKKDGFYGGFFINEREKMSIQNVKRKKLLVGFWEKFE